MSNRALESWLDEQPGSSNRVMMEQIQVRKSSARISIGDVGRRVKPKCYSLLDPANGNGLKVDYYFTSETSDISRLLVCIEASFKNCSSETIQEITLVDEESNKAFDSADQAAVVNERLFCSFIYTCLWSFLDFLFMHLRLINWLLNCWKALYFGFWRYLYIPITTISNILAEYINDSLCLYLKECELLYKLN